MSKLIYPFTFEQWINHPSTKPKLKWLANISKEIKDNRKKGKQLTLNFEL